MNLYEEIEKIKEQGFSEADAQSKLGQDIVLKAISDSSMARNATIKGGVVMRSISGDSRRATQDLDLDFIRYSISDESIRKFVEKLDCIDGLTIKLTGNIIELNHQDYKGKRINISLTDTEEPPSGHEKRAAVTRLSQNLITQHILIFLSQESILQHNIPDPAFRL